MARTNIRKHLDDYQSGRSNPSLSVNETAPENDNTDQAVLDQVSLDQPVLVQSSTSQLSEETLTADMLSTSQVHLDPDHALSGQVSQDRQPTGLHHLSQPPAEQLSTGQQSRQSLGVDIQQSGVDTQQSVVRESNLLATLPGPANSKKVGTIEENLQYSCLSLQEAVKIAKAIVRYIQVDVLADV